VTSTLAMSCSGYDWALHVREVKVSQATVAIAVTEFGFHLKYAADAQVQLAS
jgi:hypothetical protein